MLNDLPATELHFGSWQARRDTGELFGDGHIERLEPKVMDLLFLLACAPDRMCTREDIMQRLWPGLIVGEDTLARTVFKLRKALGDDAKAPRYIETLPKRGYRFLVQVDGQGVVQAPATEHSLSKSRYRRRLIVAAALSLALAAVVIGFGLRGTPAPPVDPARELTDRANDYYFQYRRVDNEAAVALFERIIAMHPQHAAAHAGLANALVQRVIRWPRAASPNAQEFTRLGDALEQGHTRTPAAKRQLQRAKELAERALQLAPNDAVALKALGFVRSAQGDFSGALSAYQQALTFDPDAWGPLINIGDVLDISGQPQAALEYLVQAFEAMSRVYPKESARIAPWYAELGLNIAKRQLALQRPDQAEQWFRRTLEIAPLHPQATAELAAVLRSSGRSAEAAKLCEHLQERIGAVAPECGSTVPAEGKKGR